MDMGAQENKEYHQREEINDCFEENLGDDDDEDLEAELAELEIEELAEEMMFEQKPKTKEYAETHYYGIKGRAGDRLLTRANIFWTELAANIISDEEKPFLSGNFVFCTNSLTEMLSVLMFLDLPLVTKNHGFVSNGKRGTIIKLASNAIVYRKDLQDCPLNEAKILARHRYFEAENRIEETTDGKQKEKHVKKFYAGVLYTCQVIMCNFSPKSYTSKITYQVPSGAIPVKDKEYWSCKDVHLITTSNERAEFHFYFPQSGKYYQYPSNLTEDDLTLARAQLTEFEVHSPDEDPRRETLNQILESDNKDEILAHVLTLNFNDPNQIDTLHRVASYCHERQFYAALIAHLQEQGVFETRIWEYSVLHKDIDHLSQYLESMSQSKLRALGPHLESKLLSYSLFDVGFLKLDYHPLVNARAHSYGDKNLILNAEFKRHYEATITALLYKNHLTSDDYVLLSNYLLLQDRVGEAKVTFAKVKVSECNMRVQYDYLLAYLDFFDQDSDLATAGQLTEQYRNYPVKAWKEKFSKMAEQLAEIKRIQNGDLEEHLMEIQALAHDHISTSFSFDFLNSKEIDISYFGLNSCTVSFYVIDLEVFFSNNPFFMDDSQAFNYVKPNIRLEVDLDPRERSQVVQIPEELSSKSVMVEIVAGKSACSKPLYNGGLLVEVYDNVGQLKVMDAETKPLSKVYIKTFAKMRNGNNCFYKDGYTDIAGRFDYIAISTDELKNVQAFSILVMSDDLGGLTRDVTPPANV